MDSFNPTPSIATTLSYDILCEIFTRCVEQSSAQALMQPNTKIAPMQLCQVCTTWRSVALSSPILWSHLRFALPINWVIKGYPLVWSAAIFGRRMDWLTWWRTNLGSMAPYLQVEVQEAQESGLSGVCMPDFACDFLFEFMSSAQHLGVRRLYQYLLRQRNEEGFEVTILPNAHTIVDIWSMSDLWHGVYGDAGSRYIISMLMQSHPRLRHLVLENSTSRPDDYTNPLHNWSTLTHLSINQMFLHLNVWFSFIRSLSNLQSGSFHLNFEDDNIDIYVQPAVGTLAYLSVLDIFPTSISTRSGRSRYPLKAVFDNLHLPALRSLSLDSKLDTWCDHTAIADVHAALQSAPAITHLSIGQVHEGRPIDFPLFQVTPFNSDIEPLSTYAPRLEHLSLRILSPCLQNDALCFIHSIFASCSWLDLKSPTSTIRKVTIVSSDNEQRQDVLAQNQDRSQLMSYIRKFVNEGVSVVSEEEVPLEVRRTVWGW